VITVHVTGSALLASRAACEISNCEVGDGGHGSSFGRNRNIVLKGCRNREVSSEPDHRHGENGIAGWERGVEAWEFGVAPTSGTHRERLGALFRAAGTACPGSYPAHDAALEGVAPAHLPPPFADAATSCDVDEGDGVPP
jgi:hypothetical protein